MSESSMPPMRQDWVGRRVVVRHGGGSGEPPYHDIVGELVQAIDKPHPATYLGSGKVEELHQTIGAERASLVIFDDELTPAPVFQS